MLIIDTSGTVLSASTCWLVPDEALSEDEWDELEAMSDSEISSLGRKRGRPVLADSQVLDAVAGLLNAEQWSSEDLDTIAEMVRSTGRSISDI